MSSAAELAVAPHPDTSDLRLSSHSDAGHPAADHNATREHPTGNQEHSDSASGSQESSISGASAASRVSSDMRQSRTSSSNASQSTVDSDSTPPPSSAPASTHPTLHQGLQPGITRVKTPEELSHHGRSPTDYALTSPMSVTSPAATTNGAKRTASGHVKNASSISSPGFSTLGYGHGRSRAESMSSSGSRAGELAASLKARLGYAMAKVQHGWEHKNFAEVERLAAQRISPNQYSIPFNEQNRQAWWKGQDDRSTQFPVYDSHTGPSFAGPRSPPSKRHSTNLSIYPPTYHFATAPPQLQPAVDIRPTTGYRHRHTTSLGQSNVPMTMMSPPRTPVNNHPRRPPTIRTQTQTAEAERDALQALFQLGSPHHSQMSQHGAGASQASSSQASPLRSDFSATPRHPAFSRDDSSSSGESSLLRTPAGASAAHRTHAAAREELMAES